MARKRRGFEIDEPTKFNPRSKLPHIAMEYYDSDRVDDAWDLVRNLKPRHQVSVIGTTRKETKDDHSRGAGRGREVNFSRALNDGISPASIG